MVNIKKLRGKMVECGLSVADLASMLGIDRATLYRKLRSGGKRITIREADLIAHALKLSYSELNAIFFDQYVA